MINSFAADHFEEISTDSLMDIFIVGSGLHNDGLFFASSSNPISACMEVQIFVL